MNRRVVGLVGAAILAILGVIILVTFVRDAEDRALEGQEVVDVLVLTEDVPAGTPAEDLNEAVEVEEIPREVVAAGAVASLEQLAGLVASVDLLENEQVTSVRFVTPERFAPARGSIDVPEGLVETTISVSATQSVGGVLRPGDNVAIVASFDGIAAAGPDQPPEGSISALLLQQVLVTNVQGAPLPTAAADGTTTVADRAAAPEGGLLVTVAVTPNNLERLTFAQTYGTLNLGLQTEDDPVVDINPQTGQVIYAS